jgi:hypothetical protein
MKRILSLLVLLAGASAVAGAQDMAPRTHVRGTIVSYAAGTLTVTNAGSDTKIALAPNAMINLIVKADASALVSGAYIGTAAVAQPDGTLRAIEVHVFPPGRKPGEGSHPYELGPNSSMTNATIDTIGVTQVDKVAGHQVVLKYEGGEKTIVIPPNTPIVTFAPGDLANLTPGAHVTIFAMKQPDGTLTAANVGVGKDGLIPPM